MGVLKLNSVSFDETKVRTNASGHKALSHEQPSKLEEQVRAEGADQFPMECPFLKLTRREERLKAIAKAKVEI